jgi:2-hydroxy-6-oxonona-2,4-dienedioate hydrolase
MPHALWWILAAVIILAASVTAMFLRDMNKAYERISGQSTVIASPFGNIEYREGGSQTGTPVLVIHGGGGGYDQGELIAETVLDKQFRWIAPSRFGYMESALPEEATWDEQAEAYTYLLDHLGIGRAAVVAMSQGGPSALLFAVNHPERVTSLTCLSCGVAPSVSDDQAQADRKGNMLKFIFRYDFTYWAMSEFFKKQLMSVIGANREVIAGLTPWQREQVEHFIEYMNPAAPRSAGAAFDNETTLPGGRIAAIKAPTLIIHAKDDLLQLYHNAEFAASVIPGARLMSYESGGHILMAVEQEDIRNAVFKHIQGEYEDLQMINN